MSHTWNLSKQYTRIKLCEFETLDAAYEASFIGADFLGFHIFSDQDYLGKADKFQEIFRFLPQTTDKTLLTDLNFDELFKILSMIEIDAIQLYNDCSIKDILLFKEKFKRVKIIKVMSEKSGENFTDDDDEFIRYYDDLVDAFLLDSFRVGGTGVTGNWTHCSQIVKKCQSPVFLAGGLTAENVSQAIRIVKPFGVDVENGVSSRLGDQRRVKNMMKCRLFIERVREVDWKIKQNIPSFYS